MIGDKGDLTWEDLDAITLQISRQKAHRGIEGDKLDLDVLDAVIRIKKVFDGATVEDWWISSPMQFKKSCDTGLNRSYKRKARKGRC